MIVLRSGNKLPIKNTSLNLYISSVFSLSISQALRFLQGGYQLNLLDANEEPLYNLTLGDGFIGSSDPTYV